MSPTATVVGLTASNSPEEPEAVTAARSGTGSATIRWSAPADPSITGYRVSRDGRDTTGYGAYTTVVAPTVRMYTLDKLIAGHTYHLSVQAINAAGTSPTISIAVVR